MGKRLGTLLEKNTERIFKRAGFDTARNYFYNGYEIDLYASSNKYRLAVQCKQYERSKLNVRDIIHQWHSKNKILGFDKVIIVVFGQDIKPEERKLARQLGVVLWSDADMDYIEDQIINNPTGAHEQILRELKLYDEEQDYKPKKTESHALFILFLFLGLVAMTIKFWTIYPFGVALIIYLIIKHYGR